MLSGMEVSLKTTAPGWAWSVRHNLLGTALRSRWLWLCYMEAGHPWASMSSAEDKQTTTFFFASVRFRLGSGTTFLFWIDPWLDGKRISEFAPDLVEVVPARRRRQLTVAQALQGMSWTRQISGALTVQVLVQYVQVYRQLQTVQLILDGEDRLEWRWSPDGSYSSRSAYAALMLGQSAVLGTKELWKTRAPNNCHFFVWLALHGRCWTAERLHRHGIRTNSSCILCCQDAETINHLLVQCVFSREIWFKVLRRCGWHGVAPTQDHLFAVWWTTSRKCVPKGRRKAFDSLVVAMSWAIWTQRNDMTFGRAALLPSRMVEVIFESIENWCRVGIINRSQLFVL
jgi:hypothetical protein